MRLRRPGKKVVAFCERIGNNTLGQDHVHVTTLLVFVADPAESAGNVRSCPEVI
jgi:hypothetical protein